MTQPIRLAFLAAALGVVACTPHLSSGTPDTSYLVPGHRDLKPAALREVSGPFTYYTQRTSGDTTARKGPAGEAAFLRTPSGEFLSSFRYAPPTVSHDSLWMDAKSLQPRREWLHVGAKILEIEYSGATVRTTSHVGDSVSHSEMTFPVPVFAFNQLETLVRSIPLRAGYQRVAPLYSEIDGKVEYDTLAVIGPDEHDAGRWIVRFADPVITQRWIVDAGTRDAVGLETWPRAAPMMLRRISGS